MSGLAPPKAPFRQCTRCCASQDFWNVDWPFLVPVRYPNLAALCQTCDDISTAKRVGTVAIATNAMPYPRGLQPQQVVAGLITNQHILRYSQGLANDLHAAYQATNIRHSSMDTYITACQFHVVRVRGYPQWVPALPEACGVCCPIAGCLHPDVGLEHAVAPAGHE